MMHDALLKLRLAAVDISKSVKEGVNLMVLDLEGSNKPRN